MEHAAILTQPRHQPVTDWLTEHNARLMASTKAPDGWLSWYDVRGRVVIVHFYTDAGWEVYITATWKNDIRATLAALERYLPRDADREKQDRLERAAPDMLEALKAVVRCLEGTPLVEEEEKAIERAHAAIAKATEARP